MALAAGDRLGPYEILALIGTGGMGDVFKARDTRLDRVVAIKVSKTEFSERFEREAHTIATLNHPHICQVYDVGPDYLVMEYIEGTPLKGPLPLALTLKYAAQICDALDAAHQKNIVHRDLKPANILVTRLAGVKLLDFGLAKLGPAVQMDDVTKTMGLTGKGEIIGTLLYMSPEQVNGQEAGPESDIFSFGLVLYEMLTGKHAFEASTPASAVAAILTRPAPSVLDIAPPSLDLVLQRCLEKEPENRWQSARDLKAALEWITGALARGGAEPALPRTKSRPSWLAWGVAAIALVLAGWGWWRASRPAAPPLQQLVRLDLDLQADPPMPQGGGWAILSPDGGRVVYASGGRLFTRRLDQPDATELPGTEAVYPPFFSPDGQWIAFAAQGKVKKISVDGGIPIALCDAPFLLGGSWGDDGNIIANLGLGGLAQFSSSGGTPMPVTHLAQGEGVNFFPQILPGGKAVLFTSGGAIGQVGEFKIEVVTLPDRRRKVLAPSGTYGRYVATPSGAGYLMYVSQGTLFAEPFDPKTLEVRGTPVPVLERVAYSTQFGYAWFSVSQNGALLYRSGEVGRGANLIQWLDAAGKTQPLLAKPGVYQRPRLSPDGRRLAIEVGQDPNEDIWIYDSQRDTMSRITFGGAFFPVWSPDGRYIVYGALASGLFWTRADGAIKPQQLTHSTNLQLPNSFTPDGKRLVYLEVDPQKGPGLWTLPIESDGAGLRSGKPEVFLETPFLEGQPSFSPDGKWLAYFSGESGAYEVYVRAFPDRGGKWQISNGGGSYPKWSRNGHELFYRTSDNQIMVVDYTAQGDSFVSGKPRPWSQKRIANIGQSMNYDLDADGRRIAAIMPDEGAGRLQAPTTRFSHSTSSMSFSAAYPPPNEMKGDVPIQSSRGTGAHNGIVVSPNELPRIDETAAGVEEAQPRRRDARVFWRELGVAVAVVGIATLIAMVLRPYLAATNLAMLYLLGVVVVAMRCGRHASVTASFLSVAAFDFFCVPPYFTLGISEYEYLITFAGMLVVALVISAQTARIRAQAANAVEREARTKALYRLSRRLSAQTRVFDAALAAADVAEEVFGSPVVIFLPDEGRISFRRRTSNQLLVSTAEEEIAQEVFDHGRKAGKGMERFPDAAATYVPLKGASRIVGVMAILPGARGEVLQADQQDLLALFANQTALAIERTLSQNAADDARMQMETEEMRSSLLSAVSHDLRTPLASITGAASTLRSQAEKLAPNVRDELLESISDEALRLSRLVGNLLDMTRLESGVELRRDLYPLEEVVGAALQRLELQLAGREVVVSLPQDLPLVNVDDVLLGQVLVNLIENATKYSPPGSSIEVVGEATRGAVQLEVRDRGRGFAVGEEKRLFEKFYRGKSEGVRGAGLGLAICRAIMVAHRGSIEALHRTGGGAIFRIRFPLDALGNRP